MPSTAESAHPCGCRVLVVDDEGAACDAIGRFLEREPCSVVKTTDPTEAVEILDARGCDLLVSDICMPGITGFDLLDHSRRTDDSVPVILVTGDSRAEVAVRALRAGATNLVLKPFSLDELDQIIGQAVRHRGDALSAPALSFQSETHDGGDSRGGEFSAAVAGLQPSQADSLRAFASALRLREHTTSKHSSRVEDYACLLARALGLGSSDLVQIRIGAALHDIGKIAVPESILTKSLELTPAERRVMQRHPEWGYRILRHTDSLDSVLAIVRYHHERWDGSGYPQGLVGPSIPLVARIFTVADAFDAMTSDRAYRGALSMEEARQEIRRCAGTQFDPDIATTFLALPTAELLAIRNRARAENEDRFEEMG